MVCLNQLSQLSALVKRRSFRFFKMNPRSMQMSINLQPGLLLIRILYLHILIVVLPQASRGRGLAPK
jgi:hypothetical protein